jgi:hypothetical protein
MKELMLTALALCLLQASIAVADGCDNRSLVGTVAVAIQKTKAQLPGSSIYMESWDGAGHIQYLESDTNGQQSSGLYYGTGTYTIGSDCIATVFYDGDTTRVWNYYIDGDGKGYTWVNGNDTGVVAAGHAELTTRALLVDPASAAPGPCTLETLHGTLAPSGEGTVYGVPFATAGFEFYDGAGNATWVSTVSNGYTTNTYHGTATYTITDRCVASVYYDGSASPAVIFVAPNGSAYWWMNNGNVGVVIAGEALRVSREH